MCKEVEFVSKPFKITIFKTIFFYSECAKLAMEDMGQYLEQKEGEVAVNSFNFFETEK